MHTKEIHERTADGVTVTLFANFNENAFGNVESVEITCHVHDAKTGEDFTISEIPPEQALEVFYHPYSVGNRLLTAAKV